MPTWTPKLALHGTPCTHMSSAMYESAWWLPSAIAVTVAFTVVVPPTEVRKQCSELFVVVAGQGEGGTASSESTAASSWIRGVVTLLRASSTGRPVAARTSISVATADIELR